MLLHPLIRVSKFPDIRFDGTEVSAVPDVAFEFGPPELHPESRKLRRVIRAFDNPDAV